MIHTEFHVFHCSILDKNITAEILINRNPSGDIEARSMIGCSDEVDCRVMMETEYGSYVHDWDSCPIHRRFQ